MEEETKNVEVPAKFKDIVKTIEGLSVLELNELVKVFEEKFGVSASAVAVAGPAAAAGDAEEKDSFAVVLAAAGEQKNRSDESGERSAWSWLERSKRSR